VLEKRVADSRTSSPDEVLRIPTSEIRMKCMR
jgi:hypothetical protein